MTVRELIAELEKLEDKDAVIRTIDGGYRHELNVRFEKTARFSSDGYRLPDVYTMYGEY